MDTSMTNEPFQWAFVIKWVIATALGWLLANPLLQLFALEFSPIWASILVALVVIVSFVQALFRKRRGLEARWRTIPINMIWSIVAVIAIVLGHAASIAGVLQWLVLWKQFSRSPWWILMSSAGALIVLFTGSVVVTSSEYLYFALAGAVIGLMQWLVLRRQLTSAGWWILASTIGWLVGGLATEVVGEAYNRMSDHLSEHAALAVAHTAPNTVGGILCGIVTGVSLAMLSRKPKSHA